MRFTILFVLMVIAISACEEKRVVTKVTPITNYNTHIHSALHMKRIAMESRGEIVDQIHRSKEWADVMSIIERDAKIGNTSLGFPLLPTHTEVDRNNYPKTVYRLLLPKYPMAAVISAFTHRGYTIRVNSLEKYITISWEE